MEQHRVLILPSAQSDMAETVNRIGRLAELPMRYPLLRNPVLCKKGYRAMPIKKFVVFYTVVGNVVQIHRVYYARRNIKILLLEDLLGD